MRTRTGSNVATPVGADLVVGKLWAMPSNARKRANVCVNAGRARGPAMAGQAKRPAIARSARWVVTGCAEEEVHSRLARCNRFAGRVIVDANGVSRAVD